MTAPTLFAEKDLTANPAPLGLMGFGMTTVLLNLHNLGLFGNSAMILAMGIFYGGLAQVIAGVLEWKKGNTFGMTAFTSYGCFWLSLVGLLVLPEMGLAEAATSSAMGAYLLMWGIFTAFLFVGTLKMDKASQFIFGSLTLLFALLAISDFSGSATIKQIAGFVGLLCGASAIYTAMAQVLNEVYGKTILCLGGKSH
ncbi:acetate uptake transporter [Deefgea salmonis]|uniref:Acetate uptake transporter n=1 Tax=Deefgea salmonis TaxID=2875502 RepID=A0ABS8BLQ6_9NEIS|nr:acetate uptake transporter [Deefgea salmonis]MCB5196660.1 acetate uptake transporter [Deefgea salmonis]